MNESILDRLIIKQPSKAKNPKPKTEPKPAQLSPPGADLHFRPLGYDRDRFFFFTSAGKQIRELTASKLGRKAELLTLAPLDWWEREFATDNGFSGRAVEMAANYLIQACYSRGVFSLENCRGRGVWCDGESIVVHAGDRLIIDGKETPLVNAQTEAVYECQKRIDIQLNNPLSKSESNLVCQWAMSLGFEKETYGILLMGWLACALASGALNWRPHIFLSGPKGCGKSSILDVMLHLLGGFALAATGGTSAAGLRQSLSSDALPVLFDEAESDSKKSAANIDDVLSLMRHASANLEARVIKGGADGKASASIVRSCFCLSAIRDPVHQAADLSRITMLSLKPASAESRESNNRVTKPLAEQICEREYASRFRSRVLNKIPEMLEAIQIFTNALKTTFDDSRMCDQIGALLGGGWIVISDQPPTIQEAVNWAQFQEWTDQNELLEQSSDEDACFQAILNAHVRVDGDEWRGELRIGDLARYISLDGAVGNMPNRLTLSESCRTLGMYGLRVEGERLFIANSDGMLARKVMQATPWPVGWNKILIRLPGAEKPPNTVKIGNHSVRCISVPLP